MTEHSASTESEKKTIIVSCRLPGREYNNLIEKILPNESESDLLRRALREFMKS